ncbi:hypothetical protein QFC19_008544 [Naganishia cerealis]|uniref:Uncharacterized protein n=1 Tax=Naganishia cerealis TaxID=610337 RepID=A0ACC2V1Q3_9TREE|nr:hypothetical protein QFC19_008544 [Naganishia cerealis]
MSGRNSPIALLSGLEMNDLMLYHRYLARFTWLQVNIHSFGFIIEGIMARHLAEDLKTPCFNWGVAYAPFIGLTILSAAIWAIDRLIRLMNRTYQSFFPLTGRAILSGTITALPGAHIRLRVPVPLTHVVVEGDRGRRSSVWKIAAGQHVRLTVPSIQWVGDHPFTVMATGRIDSHVGYFDLAIKAQRGLTRKLELAKGHHAVGSGSTSLPRIFGVMVEGPYGHLLEHIYFSDNLLLFGGGIGITYVLPHFVQFAQRRPEGTCKLVWMVRDMGCFEIIKDQLVSFAEERRLRGGLAHGSVSIDVHLTCSAVKNVSMNSDDLVEEKALGPEEVVASLEHTHNSGGPHIGNNADLKLVEPKETVRSWDIHRLSPYITITTLHGRASLLPSSHFPTSELSRTKYLSIVACGPAGMCDEARVGAVQTMAEGGWKGVEYVEECFSW